MLNELSEEDVYINMQKYFPTISFEVLRTIINFTNCHPYYISTLINSFQIDSKYYQSLSNFYDFVNNVLILQESTYLELQIMRIKDMLHAIDAIRVIALELNPYSELNYIPRSNLYKVIKYLENFGYIRIIGRARYRLTDPLLKYHLTQI